MRILANYGYKNNGDTYSVTFETMGDVPKEQADTVVDGLFRLAKAAIQRQLNAEADPFEFPPASPGQGAGKEEVVVIPRRLPPRSKNPSSSGLPGRGAGLSISSTALPCRRHPRRSTSLYLSRCSV